MQPVSLQAEFRNTGKGSARRLRQAGLMPAVLYGQGKAALSIAVKARDLERALQVGGRNALFSIELPDGADRTRTVVLKELQRHPARRGLLHVDFIEVSLTHRISVRVPLLVEGAEDVEREGLLVRHQTRDLEVECLPMEIPDHLTVSVTGMTAGDQVVAGDVAMPGDARLVSPPGEVVLSVVTARAAAEEPAEAPVEGPDEGAGEGEADD
ncbi:MAG: 50S ribosomal protein L25 [bacterium]|nr:50S ribosomal protein L25 [bacterium]